MTIFWETGADSRSISPAVSDNIQAVLRHPVITFSSGKLFHQFLFLYQKLYLLLFIDTDQKFLHLLLIALIGGQHTIAAIKMFIIPLEQTPEIRIIE